jgi:ribonuclease HII
VYKKARELKYIIGIDEVGRGPLAGPVTVCAFAILDHDLARLDEVGAKDSKVLSEQKRDIVAKKLKEFTEKGWCTYQIASTSSEIIDKKGLTLAIQMAINNALKKLNIHPEHADIYLDGGLKAPQKFFRQHTIIKGDSKIPVISCASVLAKVHRDSLMNKYDLKFPEYGFYNHKGYGTPEHYKALRKYGMTPIHRRLFLKTLTRPTGTSPKGRGIHSRVYYKF